MTPIPDMAERLASKEWPNRKVNSYSWESARSTYLHTLTTYLSLHGEQATEEFYQQLLKR